MLTIYFLQKQKKHMYADVNNNIIITTAHLVSIKVITESLLARKAQFQIRTNF